MVRKFLIPILLALSFFIAGIFTLSDYGINWDSPLHMLRGQAYAHLFLTGKDTYGLSDGVSPNLVAPPGYKVSRYYFASSEMWDDGPRGIVKLPERPLPQVTDRKIFYQHEAWNGKYFKEYDWGGHLAFTAILGSLSNRLFWGQLNLFGDVETYQLVYLLISALGVFIVSSFAMQISGSLVAGMIAGLSLSLYPLFLTESHMNLKDPAQAVFFTGAIWAFWNWVKLGRLRWFGGFVAFVALALAVKWNIVFLPLILLPWLFLIKFKSWGRLGKLGILGGLGTILFLILIWPYAWGKPFSLLNIVQYYLESGRGSVLIQPEGFILFGFNLHPLLLLLGQTPEIVLLLGGIGVIWGIRKRGELKVGYLLLLWLLVPILRLSFPGARTYGGLRQFMEVLPAMAVLAGAGANYLIQNSKFKTFKFLLVLLPFAFLLLTLIQLHPNQNTYFNVLAGGLKGAVDKNLVDWTLTYGNIYKQGVKWLNENAEKDANLAHLDGSMFAISPLWLREDISISPNHFSGFDQKGEYIMALFNPLDPPVFAKRYPERFLNPVHTIEMAGVQLLYIYKNESKYLKKGFDQEKELKVVKMIPQRTKEADFWKIDLGQDVKVIRIVVNGVQPQCIEGIKPNELITFLPDLTKAYVLNEKRDLGESRVEYSFAAESASFIYIYPQNNESCFAKDKILSVSYLN